MTMDRKELEAKICELVAISYKKDPASVTVDTSFKEDLQGASIQMVALVAEIENQLEAAVTLQEASACETVSELVDLVEEEL
jgi:acyl carrier protein